VAGTLAGRVVVYLSVGENRISCERRLLEGELGRSAQVLRLPVRPRGG
jgi:hypothetical protein